MPNGVPDKMQERNTKTTKELKKPKEKGKQVITPVKADHQSSMIRRSSSVSAPRLPSIQRGEKLRRQLSGMGLLLESPNGNSDATSNECSPSLTMTPRAQLLSRTEKLNTQFFGIDTSCVTPTKKPKAADKFSRLYNAGAHLHHSAFFHDLKKLSTNISLPKSLSRDDLSLISSSKNTLESTKADEVDSDESTIDDQFGHRRAMESFRDFSLNLTLKTPVPNDLAEIMGKGRDRNSSDSKHNDVKEPVPKVGQLGTDAMRSCHKIFTDNGQQRARTTGLHVIHESPIVLQRGPTIEKSQKLQGNLATCGFVGGSNRDSHRTNGGPSKKKRRKTKHKSVKSGESKETEKRLQCQVLDATTRVESLDRRINENERALQATLDAIAIVDRAFKNLQVIADYQDTDLDAIRRQMATQVREANDNEGQNGPVRSSV